MKSIFNFCGLCTDGARTMAESEIKPEFVTMQKEENIIKPVLEHHFLLPSKEDSLPTLVLDLDGTLIYASYTMFVGYDFEVKIENSNKIDHIYIKLRPNLYIFLEDLSKKYEIVIFTAAKKEYAKEVVKIINKHNYVKHVLYRDSCTKVDGDYVKDLSRLGRPLDKTIILDDIAASYRLQPTNGIPISPYYGKKDDVCLITMKYYLESISELDKIV